MKKNSTTNGIYKPIGWLVLLMTLVFISGVSYSQVAINNDNSAPNASAMLDVKATGLGLLAPRMTFAQRPVAPATGLIIYQTDANPGYYYFDGATWQKVGRASDQYWLPNGTDIYFNTGKVAIGTTSPASHGLNAQNYVGGKAAVRGVNQLGASLWAEGMLGVLNGPMVGVPIYAWNIGVLGIKPNTSGGSNGAAIYGWNADGFNSENYAGIFAADGVSTYTNYGIYADADNAGTNYAGYFKGRVHVEGNNESDAAGDYTQHLLSSEVTHTQYSDNSALYGKATPQPGYGIAVRGEGGYMGIYGLAEYTTDNVYQYAIYGTVSGAAGTKYGVYGYASTSDGAAYGVYGAAYGTTANWGGYFVGDAYISEDLGIGTTSPLAKVHIKAPTTVLRLEADNNPLITFYDNAATYKAWIQSFSNDFYVSNKMNGYLRFLSNNIEGMRIDPSGNVQIGSIAATGYRLAVDGKIICEELRVESSTAWPDYVFSRDYNLMSLQDLEQSIEENNHLPGLPSAAEVEENGFLVADMQKRVLEKVEELTLYTIEQGKMIENQGKIIEQLQEEIKSLKSE